jgi:serine/threonine protein kinase
MRRSPCPLPDHTDLKRLRNSAERDRERSCLLAIVPKLINHVPARATGDQTLAETIARLAAAKKRMPSAGTNAILYQLTRAVAHASALGVSHRDIRPANMKVEMSSLHLVLMNWDNKPTSTLENETMPYVASPPPTLPHLYWT